eukprot:2659780-Rhodomonas_salina.4
MPGTDLAYHPTRALYAFAEHPTDAANLNYDLHPLKVNSAICYAQTCAISGTDVAKLRYLLRTRRKSTRLALPATTVPRFAPKACLRTAASTDMDQARPKSIYLRTTASNEVALWAGSGNTVCKFAGCIRAICEPVLDPPYVQRAGWY